MVDNTPQPIQEVRSHEYIQVPRRHDCGRRARGQWWRRRYRWRGRRAQLHEHLNLAIHHTSPHNPGTNSEIWRATKIGIARERPMPEHGLRL